MIGRAPPPTTLAWTTHWSGWSLWSLHQTRVLGQRQKEISTASAHILARQLQGSCNHDCNHMHTQYAFTRCAGLPEIAAIAAPLAVA